MNHPTDPTDHVFISILTPTSPLTWKGELGGHRIEVERLGYVERALDSAGREIAPPVRYFPEDISVDDLGVSIDGDRVSFKMANQHQVIPAGNGFPKEELYQWTTKATLDGLSVSIGISPDAPHGVIDGKELPALIVLAFDTDEENPSLSSEVWEELTTEPYSLLRGYLEPSDEYDDRAWRAAFAPVLAKREQAWADYYAARANAIVHHGAALAADIAQHPPIPWAEYEEGAA